MLQLLGKEEVALGIYTYGLGNVSPEDSSFEVGAIPPYVVQAHMLLPAPTKYARYAGQPIQNCRLCEFSTLGAHADDHALLGLPNRRVGLRAIPLNTSR